MRTLTFIIPQPIDLVRESLASEVFRSPSRRSWSYELFYGEVWNDGFQVFANTPYAIGDLPRACGRFQACAEGTEVHVELKADPITIALYWLWSLAWTAVIILAIFDQTDVNRMYAWIGIAIILASWGFFSVSSWVAANHYKRGFRQVFKIEEQ